MPDPARLYLITPVLSEPEPFAASLEEALAAVPVDCVLLRLGSPDEARRRVAEALVPLVQAHGAALLVEDEPGRVGATDADGLHVHGIGSALGTALRGMKPDRIVGAGQLATRDDAMVAGEAGADYLLFGDAIEGRVPPLAARLERVGWWADIFQVPCVAWAHDLAEVEPLARAGAEFVALCEAVWRDRRGPAMALRDAAAVLDAVAHEAADRADA